MNCIGFLFSSLSLRLPQTRVLSPATTPNIPQSTPFHLDPMSGKSKEEKVNKIVSPSSNIKSVLGLKDSSTTGSEGAPSITKKETTSSIDSKIQSFLGLSGASLTSTPLVSSSKSDADKKAAMEKELQEKRKKALELLQKQSRLLNAGLAKPIAAAASSTSRQGNLTPSQKSTVIPTEPAEKPKPKPLPDPKKSEMAQKYMKEKKLQELKKKKADLAEDEKKREKVRVALFLAASFL
jgi:hypothetical protein